MRPRCKSRIDALSHGRRFVARVPVLRSPTRRRAGRLKRRAPCTTAARVSGSAATNLPGHAQAEPPRRNTALPRRLRRARRSHVLQRPNQQCMVVDLAGDFQGCLYFFHVWGVQRAVPGVEQCPIRQGPHACSTFVCVVRRTVGEGGVDPGQPFANAALPEPHRLQECGKLQRLCGFAVFAAPDKRCPEVVHFTQRLRYAPFMAAGRRSVQPRYH